MLVPNKMVGIEGDSRSVSEPNSPANEMTMSKKRRMNWDEVPGANHTADGNVAQTNNPNQGMAKDHLQMDRRKMGEFMFSLLFSFTRESL